MKKVKKGQAGYVRSQRIRRALIMLLMFAIPLTIFFSGIALRGTRNNILTVVAVVGMIPAARFAVSWIMIMLQRTADPEIVAMTEECAPDLVRGYELMVTAYEGRLNLDAIVVCGNQVVCFSSDPKGDLAFMEKHMVKILSSNDFFGVKVKIFREKKQYRDRLVQLNQDPEKYREGIKFKPDAKYPDLTRDELILHTIMAISV